MKIVLTVVSAVLLAFFVAVVIVSCNGDDPLPPRKTEQR